MSPFEIHARAPFWARVVPRQSAAHTAFGTNILRGCTGSCLSSPPFLLSFDADARNRAVLSRLVTPSRVTRKRTSKGMKATGIINAFAKTYNVSLFCRSRVKVGESYKNTSVSEYNKNARVFTGDGGIKVLREETEDE